MRIPVTGLEAPSFETPLDPPAGPTARRTPPAWRRGEPTRAGLAAERPGFFTRAARTLVGDGRHRPEPFPRPGG